MKIPFNTKPAGNFYEERAQVLRCISDPSCLKILDVLSKEGNPCVTEITKNMDVSISAVSHQLNKLKAMGIVETKRTGQTICYTMSNTKNADLVRTILLKNVG